MTPASGAGLFAVAVAGGIINSISGGGTFVVFPSLLLAGIPAVNANATNTVALWPGVISSAVAMRGELRLRTYLFPMAVISVIGGAAGATLVLALPAASFERAVPFLLLGATLLFATNPLLARSLRLPRPDEQPGNGRFAVTLLAQLGIAIYGGYFGGGIGILMLAALGLLGFTDFRTITAYRLCLSCCINAAAVVAFIIARAVYWPEALLMLVAAVLGGYIGARVVRKVSPEVLRWLVIAIGIGMSAYFFVKQA